jgi:iron(III) transport system permease protein
MAMTPTRLWLALAWAGFLLLPWYAIEDGLFGFRWLTDYPDAATASALLQGFAFARPWLLPLLLPLILASIAGVKRPRLLVAAGTLGIALTAIQGFAIIHSGWGFTALARLTGTPGPHQNGLGYGAVALNGAFLMLVCRGLAARGWCKGDAFVTGAIGVVVASTLLFVGFPVATILLGAFQGDDGGFAPGAFLARLLDPAIWGLGCLIGGLSCGVAWNTLVLATVVGIGSTVLGGALALIAVRTGFRFKAALRLASILPIITPPFVIGLAIILLLGRSGVVTAFLADAFGMPRSRWIYGFPGVALAQLLAFAPISFLVLVGVVQGISPTLEEASQTLRATRWATFRTVTLPLMRPGLANSFLIGFIESMADFGNPLVLGGNFEVLSTKIFFAVVGAAHDPSRAAVLSIVLLGFTVSAFWAQRRWLGRRVYTTVSGKGDGGIAPQLPRRAIVLAAALAIPWVTLTAVIYAIILAGGFVKSIGRDHTPTLLHYATAFAIEATPRGLLFTGSAWDSLWATLEVALVSAPLTAALGLLTAWLLARQRFAGSFAFEFATMLSFAIPGTVIGVSYILAFNVPPIELTGTGIILVICFVFRNMPVGVRSGLAVLSQIDKSLDEASLTLGARSFTTIRRVVLPLLRPAIVSAMVYSFVRAMTAVSAVIFLVSAQYNMATAYIVGRVEAGEFGLAIAYSSALIVVMLLAVGLIQLIAGERRLGRRGAALVPADAMPALGA